MDTTYQPHDIEAKHYQRWEANQWFAPQGSGEPYCIMIPPPNVTGSLHMGHAFQHTLMDTLIRYQRMCGRHTLWQTGTDHAGIATQMVVERQLLQQGQDRHQLGREAFIEKIWQWKALSGGQITQQKRRLGDSVDWQRERFTLDQGLSNAVTEVFVRLYQQGLIYRGKRLVNWDPVLHTAISDLEVDSQEEMGSLWHLRYPLADQRTTAQGLAYLVVATTRPETLLGDCAVAVHPQDERYQALIGHSVILPLTQRRIPIIADSYVDREFGTGLVKITPAHDFNDYQLGKRHNLPLINIFDRSAQILSTAEVYDYDGRPCAEPEVLIPANLAGLDRYQARQRIVEQLTQQGLLDRIEAHRIMAPRGDRSGVIVEPWLTDQWYLSMSELAQPAIEAVKQGQIEFIPAQYANEYFHWMNNIQDWCISRQLWWGHQIPAWFDQQGQVYVGRSEQEVRAAHALDPAVVLHRDDDVLDTWFSSALWTFSTLGWPAQTADLQRFHPSAVLVTGFDIIFFWVARMIMMALHFVKDDQGQGQVPFKQVYVTGLIRDEKGQKMSKSKGNVIDPLDLIDGISVDDLVAKRTQGMMQPQQRDAIVQQTRASFPQGFAQSGTDALRFTLAAQASLGRDIKFDVNRLEGYRNFCNKIWNAARYVLLNCQQQDCGQNGGQVVLSLADRWMISCLQRAEQRVHECFNQYRFDLATQTLYELIRNEYCDWYLELSKPVLWDQQAGAEAHRGTRRTLVRVLEAMLRLAHPIIPFITEEIWQNVAKLAGKQGETIMLQPYPLADESRIDPQAEAEIEWLKGVIIGVRTIRGEMDIAPGKPLPLLLQHGTPLDRQRLQRNQMFLLKLAKLDSITWLDTDETAPACATQLVGQMNLLVPMHGVIDVEAECLRLQKDIAKEAAGLERVSVKLNNPGFAQRAPQAVVEAERCKAQQHQHNIMQLQQQLDKIRSVQ